MKSKRIPLLLLGAVLCTSFLLDPALARIRTPALLAAIGGIYVLSLPGAERPLKILICFSLLTVAFVPWISRIVDATIRSNFTEEPAQQWAAPDALVGLGGQQIVFYEDAVDYRTLTRATACYWLDNNTVLVAAHYIPGLARKNTVPIMVVNKVQIEPLTAEILFNSNNGVALKISTEFLPASDLYPIASTREIVVGAEAQIISSYGGSFPVLITGFYHFAAQDMVVIERISRADNFVGGMSGSPVVQNGKIVAFMSGTFRKRERYAVCNIAAEVYGNTARLLKRKTHGLLEIAASELRKPEERRPLSYFPQTSRSNPVMGLDTNDHAEKAITAKPKRMKVRAWLTNKLVTSTAPKSLLAPLAHMIRAT